MARALEAAYITGDEGGDAWRDRMTELREALRLALARIEAEGGLAPGWIAETAADWAWARVQPGSWAGYTSEKAMPLLAVSLRLASTGWLILLYKPLTLASMSSAGRT